MYIEQTKLVRGRFVEVMPVQPAAVCPLSFESPERNWISITAQMRPL